MNHRPILPLMLLMTVLIALFFLLNLLLGQLLYPLVLVSLTLLSYR